MTGFVVVAYYTTGTGYEIEVEKLGQLRNPVARLSGRAAPG